MMDFVAARHLSLRQCGQYTRQSWGAGSWFAGCKWNVTQHARVEHSERRVFRGMDRDQKDAAGRQQVL